jgi:hypothetical protein
MQFVDSNGNILNPCYLTGYNESYYANSSTLVFGTSNYAACSNAILEYIVVVCSVWVCVCVRVSVRVSVSVRVGEENDGN